MRGQNQTKRCFARKGRLPTQHRRPLQAPGFPCTGVEGPAAPSRPCPRSHIATPPAAKCSRHKPQARSPGESTNPPSSPQPSETGPQARGKGGEGTPGALEIPGGAAPTPPTGLQSPKRFLSQSAWMEAQGEKQKPTSGDVRKLPPSEPAGPTHNRSSQRRLHPPQAAGGSPSTGAFVLPDSAPTHEPRRPRGPATAPEPARVSGVSDTGQPGDQHGRGGGEDAGLHLRARNRQGCSRQTMRGSLSGPRARPGRQPGRHREALP